MQKVWVTMIRIMEQSNISICKGKSQKNYLVKSNMNNKMKMKNLILIWKWAWKVKSPPICLKIAWMN